MTRIWTATAPVRVADLGGWTDTWFAGHGEVCSLAVGPGVEVVLSAEPGRGSVVIDAADLGDRYVLAEGRGRHPLLEACIDEVPPPAGVDVVVTVRSAVPPGASTGTSASVAVALLGALDALAGRRRSADEVAAGAHLVETVRLGRQAGIQDQRAAAHGGANRITMRAYPDDVAVARLALAPATRQALDDRLLLVLLARPHVSTAVHEEVIASLEGASPGEVDRRLEPLRAAARAGADALEAGDLGAYAAALVANTEAQAALHPGLVSAEAAAVIEAARRAGATGWKVNGAGGDGGSLTLLAEDRAAVAAAVEAAVPGVAARAVTLDHAGLVVRASG
jgi:D-glycero-alpha-D-manno-heptose-7-phosphate kinase